MLKNYTNKLPKNKKVLQAVYKNGTAPEFISRIKDKVTYDNANKKYYVYLDKIKNYVELRKAVDKIINSDYEFDVIDLDSFVNEKISNEDVLTAFYTRYPFFKENIYNVKTEKTKSFKYPTLVMSDAKYRSLVKELLIISENVTRTRDLQITPPNVCNSEWLADYIVEDFRNLENVEVQVLGRKEIEDLGMGLMLSVNRGSTFEPRVVVINYTGNTKKTQRMAFVGKGITFDTGGVNTKGYFMEGMKYDMSGSVIAAYALKSIAQLKLKVNASAVMMITDNRLDGDASLPENVYVSMSKKTVEIVDTDAEGRLVLADGNTYAKDVLKANLIVDVATLTGSMVRALGSVYSGIYSTSDENWLLFAQASQIAREKVWRMPLHEDFHKYNQESKVADLLNCSNDTPSDSNTAAMFLKEFVDDVDFIHCDVAGTADRKQIPQGELVATLTYFAKLRG
ncbi:M17 family metallopeptidase [Mycoplasma sp. 1573]